MPPLSSSKREAVAALKRGEAVIFPTETVYGLGVSVEAAASPEALYAFRDPLPRTGKGEVARFQMAQVLEERTDGVKEIKMKGRNV